PIRDGVLNEAARLDVNDLRLDGLPLTVAVLVVHANLVDVGERHLRLRRAGDLDAALVDYGLDDAVGGTGLLQRDERVRVGGVLAGLRADGLDDEIVGEA